MKFNKINQIIIKDIIKRKKYLKNEILTILIKILLQNQNISFQKKMFFIFFKNFKSKQFSSISKQQNVCVSTGNTKTTFKISNFNRRIFKQYLDLGLLTNFKKNI